MSELQTQWMAKIVILMVIAFILWVYKRLSQIPETVFESTTALFTEEIALKLELVKHYLAIEDLETAQELLREIEIKGSKEEQLEARNLLLSFESI